MLPLLSLIGLAGVAFGDDIILPPVRVDGDATKMATQSYKFCWTAMREVNGMREDPLVISNKPKGSLDLALQIRIPVPNQKRFRYSELVAGIKEANHLFRKALGILAILAPQTKDLTFVFASSGSDRPEVTVFWNGSPETKVADDDGMVTIRVNESTKENPYVLVSEIPEKILAIPQR